MNEKVHKHLNAVIQQTRFANGALEGADTALTSAKVHLYEQILAATTGHSSKSILKQFLADRHQSTAQGSASTPTPSVKEDQRGNAAPLKTQRQVLERSLNVAEQDLASTVSRKTTPQPLLSTDRSDNRLDKRSRVSPLDVQRSVLNDHRRVLAKDQSLKLLSSRYKELLQQDRQQKQAEFLKKQAKHKRLQQGKEYGRQVTIKHRPSPDPVKQKELELIRVKLETPVPVRTYIKVPSETKLTPLRPQRLFKDLHNRSVGSLKPEPRPAVNYLAEQRKQRESKERNVLLRLEGTAASVEYLNKRPWVLQSLADPFNPQMIKAEESLNSKLIEVVRSKLKQLPSEQPREKASSKA